MTYPSSSLPNDTEISEPGGPGQSLPAAGIFAICAASLRPDPSWLRSYLDRCLQSASGLQLHDGARKAIIEQAVEIATSSDTADHAAEALHGYLSASSFSPGQAVPLVSTFLQADVIASTVYDARAREALIRFVTALRLPPRLLYLAETALATFVQALSDNARTPEGANSEAVPEDERWARRRRNIKWLKVGAAGVVGGLALGLSGGLIAPALLPALGTVGLAGVSAPLTALGSGGAVALGGLFGAAGAGVGAAAMSSRAGVVDEFRFEPCTAGVRAARDAAYKSARVSPRDRVHDVTVPWREEADGSSGGLLVWEILTSQEHTMVVPGLISFIVGFRDSESTGEKISWLLPEEQMEVGGMDRERVGESKRRRSTGAITVQGSGEYVLRFRLMPGSLPVNISYRVTIVPPGKDPPLWVMEENETQPQELVTADMRSLSMVIFIPGLVTAAENGTYPGMCADQFISVSAALSEYEIQCFALRWDTELLLELSDALRKLIGKMALSMAAQKGVMAVPIMAGVAGVLGAVSLPMSIISALRTIIGNIWARTLSHAEECGYMLAAELASRSFGNRPVVLAGYSAGATVVFSCLRELARRKLVGIVHDAILIGAACTADVHVWREIRSVVSGRLVNVYSPQDWYLELYHRGTNLGSVAGTRPINDSKGLANVENVCLEHDFINNHTDYAKRCSEILKRVGLGDAERRRPWEILAAFEEVSEDEEGTEDVDENYVANEAYSETLERAWNTTERIDDANEVTLFIAKGRHRSCLMRAR